jgi:hypothetical protein
MTPLLFELMVLAKPYFNQQDLLVACDAQQVRGFIHLAVPANGDQSDDEPSRAIISALCVTPSDDDCTQAMIAERLIEAAENRLRAKQVSSCTFRPMLPDCPFYLGLGYGDSMMGVTTAEQRIHDWLLAAGFAALQATSMWQVDLSKFQAPVDRLQIQVRRTAHVDRILDEPQLPWRQACMLGHAEPMGFQLTLRAEARVVEQLLMWTIAPEITASQDSVAWLWPIQIGSRPQASDQLIFLMAEALRQLADERVDIVRTTTDSSNTSVNGVLSRLGFKNHLNGVVLEKRY